MTYKGHVENGIIVLDEPTSLPHGARVRVEVIQAGEVQQNRESAARTHFEHYESIIGAIDDLPEDFAVQHDHYIHGTPKK